MSHRLIPVPALITLAVVIAAAVAAGPAAARPLAAHGGAESPNGTWKRLLTQADIDRTATFRVEPPGSTPPPPGPVMLAIETGTFTFTDETGFAIGQTIRTRRDGAFEILTYVAPDKGAFCTADEPQNAAYTWKLEGATLVLAAVDDRCADRNSILAGRWKRASVTRTLVAIETRVTSSATRKAFTDRVTEGGKAAGSDAGVCTVPAGDCRIVLRLRDGTIVLHGKLNRPRTQKLAITGGTGAYAGARGSVAAKRRSASVTVLTLRIT